MYFLLFNCIVFSAEFNTQCRLSTANGRFYVDILCVSFVMVALCDRILVLDYMHDDLSTYVYHLSTMSRNRPVYGTKATLGTFISKFDVSGSLFFF
jgi:hypothetical protein